MKFRYLILSIICFTASLYPTAKPVKASAGTKFLRVISTETPFYKNIGDEQPLFFLPYTYYVKVIDKDEDYTHVEFSSQLNSITLDGFVPTGLLFDDNLSVLSPYPAVPIVSANACMIYEDSTLLNALQYVFSDRQLVYYGQLQSKSNETLYYVNYNERFGYIKESDVVPFAISNHPNELTFLPDYSSPETNPDTKDDEQTTSVLSIKIVIISCLIFAGAIGLFFAFKKRPKTNNITYFYDENDYE